MWWWLIGAIAADAFVCGWVVAWLRLSRDPEWDSAERESVAHAFEAKVAQPIVLERYREAAERIRAVAAESKLDRDVREAIEAAER